MENSSQNFIILPKPTQITIHKPTYKSKNKLHNTFKIETF